MGYGIIFTSAILGLLGVLLVRKHRADVAAVLRDAEKYRNATAMTEARFQAFIENTTDMIWETDLKLVFTYCSPNVASVLGYTVEEIIGKSLLDFNNAEESANVRKEIERTPDFASVSPFERSVVAKDGRRIAMETGVRRVLDAAGVLVGYRGFDRDLSRRNALEAEVRQGHKMEVVGRLAGGIAHDFNNTLTVISACTSLLKESPDEDVQRYAGSIHKAVERSAGMTRQLLAFSRKQLLQPKVLDLNRLLRELHKMLDRLIGEDIEISSELTSEPWFIKADPGQIEQVILNLVFNARDAMPNGGKILLRTQNITVERDMAAPEGFTVPAGDYVKLSAIDTGHGMDGATLSRVFEPFFTTKTEGKGTGLGLASVYGVVKQSNGFVTAESEPGRGTAFDVLLPRALEIPDAMGVPVESKARSNGTVLLVEDEEPVRLLISEVLENQGYRVHTASGRDEAVAICREIAETIDILLTDVVMPKARGPEVAAEITAMRPDVKVLFMSGYTGDMIGSHGVLSGDINLIYKPFTPDSLVKTLDNILKMPVSSLVEVA